MSWKSLRSPSMIDVIFNGNSTRSPLGLAEVTLTFDNASSQLPVQYTEVSVTRRLYRSGESEYFLNKTSCRLRDIRELFLDTGIGGDGYAVIDQGGVDFILRSKPEERRSMFEEAAGVAKYRVKREEALRKMEKVEADLARLQDSIALINEQIKKLDSDARKAKLYQKYKEELTAQEVGQIFQEVGSIAAEMEKESAAIEPVRENLRKRQVDLDAEEGRLAALRLERTEQEAAVNEFHQKIAGLKSEIGRLEERIQHTAQAAQETRARKVSENRELEQSLGRLQGMGPELGKARESVKQAEEKRASAQKECDEFHQRLEAIETDIRSAQDEIKDLRAQGLQASQAVMDASSRLTNEESLLGQRIYQVRQTIKELQRKTKIHEESAAQSAAHIADSLEQYVWVDAFRRGMGTIEGKIQGARANLAELSDEAMRLHAQRAQLKAHVHALETQGGQDRYWVGAQAVAVAAVPGVVGTVRSVIEVENGFESAVEDALGDRLYAVLCEDLRSAENAIEFLERTGKGRVRILVMTSLPDAANIAATPPQAKALMDHMRCNPRAEKALRFLLGECFSMDHRSYGRHWICGGAEATEGPSVKFSDLETLTREIGRLDEGMQELAGRKSYLEGKLTDLEETARSTAAAQQEETARWNAFQVRSRHEEEQGRLLGEEVEFLEKQARQLLAEIAESKEEIVTSGKSLQELKVQEASIRGKEQTALERVNGLKAEVSAQQRQEGMLQDALRQWESQCKFLKDQHGRLAAEEESLKSSADRHRQQIRQMEDREKDLARVEQESKAALEGNRGDLAGCEQKAQALSTRLAELSQAAQTLEQSIHRLRAEHQELQDQLHQWEVRAGGLQSRHDSLKGRLWDEWQLTLEEASSKYPQVAVDAEKIQTLRKRIQNMGNINLAAPEEYEALSQKHQFLLAQVEDLNKAKEDLRAAISKINATTREHFRQTFTEVREHFRRIYAALFEGGEADLVLTDQENLLETGVDIVAQPPGKRLQSVTLLSGGERTLTAIALLFAFFMVKASPVCMLDEADAALDEANVERFADMLREFSSKSQFLMISHNKRTLEAADRVYGVTMEESGVSQIISVDFRKKQAPAGTSAAAG
jgi:chromosome segregation protein